jgi:hypothetical protein
MNHSVFPVFFKPQEPKSLMKHKKIFLREWGRTQLMLGEKKLSHLTKRDVFLGYREQWWRLTTCDFIPGFI